MHSKHIPRAYEAASSKIDPVVSPLLRVIEFVKWPGSVLSLLLTAIEQPVLQLERGVRIVTAFGVADLEAGVLIPEEPR